MPSAGLAEHILTRVPVPLWVIDGDGTVAFANDAAADALGYRDPAHLRGLQGHDTVHHHHPDGSDYPVADCPLLRPRRARVSRTSDDQWFIRRDGSLFPIAWTAAPIDLPGGRGTVLSFEDVADERTRREAVRAREWAELPGHPPTATDRAALLGEIKSFAATHAPDPALTSERLARQHHISLRALQVLFSEHGGSPARFIRDERLANGRRLLLEGCTVSAAARRSGFSDTGTFTRAFRRSFGTTPTTFLDPG